MVESSVLNGSSDCLITKISFRPSTVTVTDTEVCSAVKLGETKTNSKTTNDFKIKAMTFAIEQAERAPKECKMFALMN